MNKKTIKGLVESLLKRKVAAYLNEDKKRVIAEAFAAKPETTLSEGLDFPTTSSHLADYKKTSEGVYEHPEGHKIKVTKGVKGWEHFTAGVAKSKKGVHALDLHDHVSKVHNKYDEQLANYVSHYHSNPMALQTLLGKLDYKMKKSDYSGNREEDAIRYKAMRNALMKMQRKETSSNKKAFLARQKDQS